MPNRIKQLREIRGWSQAELGSRLNPPTSQQQIDKLEKGQRRMTVDWLNKFAAAFECDPLLILGEVAPMTPKEQAVLGLFRGLTQAVLGLFRGLTAEEQDAFLKAADAMAKLASGRKTGNGD